MTTDAAVIGTGLVSVSWARPAAQILQNHTTMIRFIKEHVARGLTREKAPVPGINLKVPLPFSFTNDPIAGKGRFYTFWSVWSCGVLSGQDVTEREVTVGGGGSTMEAALQGVSVSISMEGMLTPWLPDAPPISTLHPLPPSLLVWGLTPPLRYLISPPSFRRQMGARVRLAACLTALNVTPCKAKRQYLLTFQVGSYCLLALREECCRARGRMFVTLSQNQLFLHSGQSPI